jgi:hypothetical protein
MEYDQSNLNCQQRTEHQLYNPELDLGQDSLGLEPSVEPIGPIDPILGRPLTPYESQMRQRDPDPHSIRGLNGSTLFDENGNRRKLWDAPPLSLDSFFQNPSQDLPPDRAHPDSSDYYQTHLAAQQERLAAP